ncbi:YczE/YyaS/YitT family protein [Streptomyces sp. 142MFCol3.1]|uniref:membrane protein YczE n=1 Tax=Streptomyces sp. 142MFCol3.1 TaxID=1172179 RepID=UPI003B635269
MDGFSSQATECHEPGQSDHRGHHLSIRSARSHPVESPSGPQSRRLPRRLVQLYVGLALYGASSALLVESGLGLEPWNVLHQGLAELTGLTIGVVSIIVGAAVLLLWIPLRQRPGLGTVSNVFVVGIAMDGTLALLPDAHTLAVRIPLLVAGVLLNGVATGLYISARFGPGPRDGLMTGLHRRTGRSIRVVRTVLELAVVATGFALGGTVGVGTVLYAVAIGPLAQLFLRVFAVPTAPAGSAVVAAGQPERAILPG